ncbi:MAG: copper resistance protein CopB [Sphingomonas sp.]|nr:copper resistance protein CopB [Sphingomonas sp.]
MTRALLLLPLLFAATPAAAQHMHMDMPMPAKPKAATGQKAAPKPAPMPPAKRRTQTTPAAKAKAPAAPVSMDMPSVAPQSSAPMQMQDHGAMDMPVAPTTETPPPAAAGSGPPTAADAIYGADAMAPSRETLRREQGAQKYFWFMADRLEYRAHKGKDGYLWDVQGYYGGDVDKLWFKSEGEGAFGGENEQAEVQALYSHAIGPWFDLQTGVRHDFAGPDRTDAVIGVQGLAPYMFEIDAAAFLSTKGELRGRIEAELDQRITQRLRLQPRAEINLSAQDIRERGVGAGIDTAEIGVRLRYEIAREFAPYIGVEQEWRGGNSADFARARGDDPSVTNFVAGIRLWF